MQKNRGLEEDFDVRGRRSVLTSRLALLAGGAAVAMLMNINVGTAQDRGSNGEPPLPPDGLAEIEATFDMNGAFDNAGLPKINVPEDPNSVQATFDPNGPFDNEGLEKGVKVDEKVIDISAVLATFTRDGAFDNDDIVKDPGDGSPATLEEEGGIAGGPVPPNNSCGSPTILDASDFGFNPPLLDITGATVATCENQENCEAGDVGVSNSVWYSFTPPADGTISINTNGSSYDTVLSIWTGCAFLIIGNCLQGPQLACDDDSGVGTDSQILDFAVTAGTTYLIKVADYNTTDGGGDLDFNMVYTHEDCGTGTNSCFYDSITNTPFCNDADCCSEVCAGDPFCCNVSWDGLCAGDANDLCGNAECPGSDNCFESHPDVGCNIEACCNTVCTEDPFCCNTSWDGICAGEAYNLCAPPNDTCSTGTVIPTNVYDPPLINTATANVFSSDPQESCESGDVGVNNTVFFTFTPNRTGLLNVNTNGSSYDTVLSVFSGTCATEIEVACDDDGGTGLDSQLLDVPLTNGVEYHIKVAQYDTELGGGDLDFNFEFIPNPPVNDTCATATAIGDSFNPPLIDTLHANASLAEPQENCEVGNGGVSHSVWYSFAPDQNGLLRINTNGSNYDTVLAIFSGTCAAPVQVACDDDSGTGLDSQLINVPLTGGVTYRIKVSQYGLGGAGGSLDLNSLFYPAVCGPNNPASCGSSHGTPGCHDFQCCGIVCAVDPFCCNVQWDGICVNEANSMCDPPCLGDCVPYGGDGVVNVDDLVGIINAWGSANPQFDVAPPPLGNGTVNVDDLILVINNWGTCP